MESVKNPCTTRDIPDPTRDPTAHRRHLEHAEPVEHAGDHPDTATTATTATDVSAGSLRCSSEPMLPDVSALPYAADS